jgi:hypothetical protein
MGCRPTAGLWGCCFVGTATPFYAAFVKFGGGKDPGTFRQAHY